MKIISLKNTAVLIILSLVFSISGCSSVKTPEEPLPLTIYKQNLHYKKIIPAIPTDSSDKRIEIVEVFFYACPHCNELDAKLQPWLEKNKDIINFKRLPAILGPTWADQAKAYYVAEELDILDTIHPALLKAIHTDKRKFHNESSVMEFFVENGVDRQRFIEVYTSPQIAKKVNHARIMTVKYGLRGVPAIIINGKYKTAPFYMNSQKKMLDVVDFLIAKERASML